MGNFYTSITLRHESADEVDALLRALGRTAYVASTEEGFHVVCDERADRQDVQALDDLAYTLAHRLRTSALAVLNHDDDQLLVRLFDASGLVHEYLWSALSFDVLSTSRRRLVREARVRFGSGPTSASREGGHVPWIVRGFSRFFAVTAHQRLVTELGLPAVSVGAGYTYVSRGEFDTRAPRFRRV